MHFEYRDDATSPLPCWCDQGHDHRGAQPAPVTVLDAAPVAVPTKGPRHRAEPRRPWARKAS